MNVLLILELTGAAAVVAALAWGLWAWFRAGAGQRSFALLRSAIPLYVCLIPLAIYLGAKGHCEDWDAARLCVSVAWTKGFQVYAGLSEGAIHTTMYPPGWVLAYVPAALASTPAGVMKLGNLLAPFYFLLPLLCLRPLVRAPRVRVFFAVGILLFVATQVESLRWACFSPHADAPALGFGLLAVIATQAAGRADAGRSRRLLLAALCAGLAVWCKQTMLPILPGLVLWPLVQRQPRRTMQLFALLAATGLLLAAISLCLFPAQALWLNLVAIPGHHPWRGHFPFNVLSVLLQLAPQSILALILLAASSVVAVAALPRGRFVPWMLASVWAPTVLVALLLVPFSLMGAVKVGGGMNSLSPTHYFLFAALVIQWIEMALAFEDPAVAPHARRGLTAGMAVMLWLVGAFWMLQSLQDLRYGLPDVQNTLCQKAYDHLRSGHPPRAFFPAYPLAHLLAEGKLYHYAHAMADRDEGGDTPISPAQRDAHWPVDTDVVCWTARQFGAEHTRATRFFPGFTEPAAVPALPDFRCFQNPEAGAPAQLPQAF